MPPLSRNDRIRLAAYGILEDFPDGPPCDLSNDIHPLFVRQRWVGISDEEFTDLTPALRLASLFLTIPSAKRCLVKLSLANLITDEEQGRNFLAEIPHITREKFLQTDRILIEAANYLDISFGIWVNGNTPRGVDTDAETRMDWSLARPPVDPPSFGVWNSRIRYHYRVKLDFHQQYIDYFREKPIHNRSVGERSRLYFVIAQILLHELAHVLEKLRFETLMITADEDINIWYNVTDSVPELGFSFEQAIFPNMRLTTGGFSHFIPADGLWSSSWSDIAVNSTDGELYVKDPNRLYGVPNSWVNQFFRQDFWHKVETDGWENVPKPVFKVISWARTDNTREFTFQGPPLYNNVADMVD